MSRAPRVCMYVEFLYPVVSEGRVPFAGGIEVQLTLMGRGLARRGFDVHVVTCDYGQPDRLQVEGLTLHRAYPPSGGLPVLRFFHPRLTKGLAALWRADADVYLFRGAALWAGLVALLARLRGRRFVWLTGHDHDVRRDLPDVHGVRDRALVLRAIRGADAIVTQTRHQQARLLADFGRTSTVIMNSVELVPAAQVRAVEHGDTLVWLSTYKPEKRPEWFTRFAERHPAIRCRMIGVIPETAAGRAAHAAACGVAARCPNLSVEGAIPHERIDEAFEGAALFAHSSPVEGFPNTLLESWSRGIPAVSCVDPDGIVERERIGACHVDEEAWARAIEARWADPARRRDEGARARAWVERHHAPEVVHEALAERLRAVLRGSPRTRDDAR